MNTLLDFFDSDKDKIGGNFADREWVNMPEFVQEKDEPHHKLIVRFASQEDLDEFSKMIGQKIGPKTTSIWHPKLEHGKNAGLRWVDDLDGE